MLAGKSKPPNVVSWMDLCGMLSGACGCKRNVSFTTAFRYGRLGMSVSVTILSFPITLSSSSCSFFAASGCRTSSEIPHSTMLDDVSVPATIMS